MQGGKIHPNVTLQRDRMPKACCCHSLTISLDAPAFYIQACYADAANPLGSRPNVNTILPLKEGSGPYQLKIFGWDQNPDIFTTSALADPQIFVESTRAVGEGVVFLKSLKAPQPPQALK